MASATAEGGWFGTEWEAGRWWLRDPRGRRFFSAGLNCVLPRDGAVKPTSIGYDVTKMPGFETAAWAESARERLEGWGFTTVASWSEPAAYRTGMPGTMTIHLTGNKELATIFEPEREREIRARAKAWVDAWGTNRDIIGYFTDNELPWYGDWGWPSGGPNLLQRFGALDGDSRGKTALVAFFRERYREDWARFTENWDVDARDWDELARSVRFDGKGGLAAEDVEEWAGRVADRYGRLVSGIMRELDPHHLNLGIRIAGNAPDPVIRAIGPYVDVFSMNCYQKSGHIPVRHLNKIHMLSGRRPIMITEFSFRAMENRSGDSNTGGADVTVPTQAERGARARTYITELLALPYIVGYHWFLYFDQSPGGRTFDGENSNYGLVDIEDKEYTEVTSVLRDLNGRALELHAAAKPLSGTITGTPRAAYTRPAIAGRVALLERAIAEAGELKSWGDEGAGAKTVLTKTAPGAGWLKLAGPTGGGWGWGWTFPLARNSAEGRDLTGAEAIVVRARAPRGARLQFFVAESGAAASDAASFTGARGADGESYSGPVLRGTGTWTDYRIPLESLNIRPEWGNQGGNQTLDHQALSWIDLYVPGGQGEIAIEVESVGCE